MTRVIYMDNHATTPVDPRVLEAMLPFFGEKFGNAASRSHAFGWEAEEAVDAARTRTAKLIGAKPKEILFTSGATESNNLALKGVLELAIERGNHIVTVVGRARVTYLPVDREGAIDPDDVRKAIDDKTVLVSVMLANNEIGTIHPLAEIGRITRERGVLLHSDATQAVGKIPVDVEAMGIDLLSLSAHKLYGPKGSGALYARSREPRVRLAPQLHGGGHERGMRSGTLNVPGIVGLGKACEIAGAEMGRERETLLALRERLHRAIARELDGVRLNGHPTRRLDGNLNLSFSYVDGESLLVGLNDVAVSSGSACTSATLQPSHVLRALGIGDELAESAIRFGIGRFNTAEEVDHVAGRVVAEVRRLRALSAGHAAARRRAHASAEKGVA
jgi:cysteine desulfurase